MRQNLNERQIANALINNGMGATWPYSRHLGQVAQVAAEKRGYRQLRAQVADTRL